MANSRAADDFDTIRARIEELRRERSRRGAMPMRLTAESRPTATQRKILSGT